MNFNILIIGGPEEWVGVVDNVEILSPVDASEFDAANENLDANITLETGERYGASFFTLNNIQSIMERHRNSTNECLGGKYFCSVDMIILDELSLDRIVDTVTDLIKNDQLASFCQRFVDDIVPADKHDVDLGTD